MSHSYDWSVRPPSPALPVSLLALKSGATYGPVNALVDTGADATIVPAQILLGMNVEAVESKWLRMVGGPRRQVRMYPVDVRLAEWTFPGVPVVGDPFSEIVIVGRDILNRLILLLDGPRAESELFEQRPK